MSASAVVGAAIEYLEELRSASTPGPWEVDGPCVSGAEVDVELVVALHRSSPVLLTILRAAHRTCVAQESRGEVPEGPGVDLAAAILGGIA